MQASDMVCICQLRRPVLYSALTSMRRGLPIVTSDGSWRLPGVGSAHATAPIGCEALVDGGALADRDHLDGVGLMWQTIPVHRWELAGSLDEDSGPPLPPGADLDEIQRLEDGVGTLFHRVYRVPFAGAISRPTS